MNGSEKFIIHNEFALLINSIQQLYKKLKENKIFLIFLNFKKFSLEFLSLEKINVVNSKRYNDRSTVKIYSFLFSQIFHFLRTTLK